MMIRVLLCLFSSFYLLSFPVKLAAAVDNEREYQIKAAFIANFIRYTRWQSLPKDNFYLCNSNQKINHIFEKTLAGDTWFELTPKFKFVDNTSANQCNVLFIDKTSAQQWKQYSQSLEGSDVLIISESRGYANVASHINFYLADNKLRFEVNPDRVHTSHLSINSSLLRLARITSKPEKNDD